MNDHSDAPKLWAAKGESVTCLKGHPICDIAHDLYVGDGRAAGDFCNWRQPEPDVSAQVATLRCAQCRSVWIRGNPREGYQFHFGNDPHPQKGWR
jgi:hypothetical protein